jgi:hypothetical protein
MSAAIRIAGEGAQTRHAPCERRVLDTTVVSAGGHAAAPARRA